MDVVASFRLSLAVTVMLLVEGVPQGSQLGPILLYIPVAIPSLCIPPYITLSEPTNPVCSRVREWVLVIVH